MSANYFYRSPHWHVSIARWEENAPVQADARCRVSSRWHSWHCSGWMHSECIMGCLHQQLQWWCWCKTIPCPQPWRGTVRLQHGTDGSVTAWSPIAAGVTWLSCLWNHIFFSSHIEVSANTGLVPCYVSAGSQWVLFAPQEANKNFIHTLYCTSYRDKLEWNSICR